MDFRSLIQSLDTINEDSKVHKGTYGTSYGKEDVRDQYGHRVGKVNKGAEAKKDEPKKGRGRPKKGAGTSGEDKTYDSSALSAALGAGKKPSKEVGKRSVKHSLKEYIEEAELALNEDAELGVKPLPGASEITMNNQPTGITAKDPQSATKIKDLMATGDISLPGASDSSNGVNNSLGENEFDDEHSGHDPAEYDMEGDFVKTQLHTIARSTRDLEERISDQEDLPEWVEMKISQAQGMLASVSDYMDSQHERDTEHEIGEEEMVSEKAKSKAQQRFFGMVHAMQKGKKVSGASSELKGVAKGIGKKDAKDFAKTKHKGLPDHVSETSFEDQGVMDEGRVDDVSNSVKSIYYPDKTQAPIKKSRFAYDRQGEANFKKYPDQTSRPAGMNADPASRYKMGEGEKPHPVELDMIGKTREMGVQNRSRDAEQRMANRAAEPKNFMQKVKKDIGGPLSKLAKGDFKGALSEEDVSEESKGLWANIHAKQKRIKNGSGEHMRKPGSKGAPTKDALSKAKTEDVAEGFPAYAKGNKKFGKDGMQKLRDKEAAGASKKEMQATRDEFNKYKKKEVDEAKDLPGKQDKLDVAKPKGKLTKDYFKAPRDKKKVKESTDMKQLTEGEMKELQINFQHDAEHHKGDTSVYDLKRAYNVQQAEEMLKSLIKHSDKYSHLSLANQNVLVNDALKMFAHDPDLPFNKKSKDPFANLDSQRYTNRTPKNMSSYTQHPGTKPGSDFSKPGSPMAIPRTSPATDSSGFLKTLSTPTTFKESNSMRDKQFESWEQELNSLLTEGITVSHSTGQQGSPDSLSINATEHDAGELMSILRNSGMEMFGGGSKEQHSGYGAPEQGGEEGGEKFHQGIEIAPSPEVVGDGDDMLALIKKMSGIESDSNTPGSVEVDYEDEEGNDEDHGEECDDCGHSPCSCDDEGEELSELTAEHPGGETPLPEGDMDEGNEFSGELAKAKAQHKDHFKVDGKEYPVKEDEMEEGNAFTGQLAKTEKGGEFKMGDKTYKDTSSLEEGHDEDCMECGYPMESCGCEPVNEMWGDPYHDNAKVDAINAANPPKAPSGQPNRMTPTPVKHHTYDRKSVASNISGKDSAAYDYRGEVEEGYANDAGGDAMGDAELLQLKELLGRGNDLHRQKHTQATGNIQKVTMETKLLKDSTSLLQDFRKLSGIK